MFCLCDFDATLHAFRATFEKPKNTKKMRKEKRQNTEKNKKHKKKKKENPRKKSELGLDFFFVCAVPGLFFVLNEGNQVVFSGVVLKPQN